jgi:hypothetical protein
LNDKITDELFLLAGRSAIFHYTPLSTMNKSIVALVNKFEKKYSKWWFSSSVHNFRSFANKIPI